MSSREAGKKVKKIKGFCRECKKALCSECFKSKHRNTDNSLINHYDWPVGLVVRDPD